MQKHVKIGKIMGIEITLHYSWFFIALLLSWGLAKGYFPDKFPGLTIIEYWLIGSVSAILLFVSVLLHELSHAIVAKYNKIPIERIQLFFFGGVAFMRDENIKPKTEFLMAIAGPICSLVLASIFFTFQPAITQIHISAILHYLARINLVLGIFNLVPGFPLDGGRALRAVLWSITGDFEKATYYASRGGKFFGMLLIFFGFVNIFAGALGGVWFVLIGGFIYFLAEISFEQAILKTALTKVQVKDVMLKKFKKLSPSHHIDEVIKDYFFIYKQQAYPVFKNTKLLGFITIDAIKKIPLQLRHKERVKDHYIAVSRFKTLKETDNLYRAFMRIIKKEVPVLPVMKNKKLVGLLSKERVLNYIKTKVSLKK